MVREQDKHGAWFPRMNSTYGHVDKMLSPNSAPPNFVADNNVTIGIDMEDRLLGLVFNLGQISGKLFNSLGERNISTVVTANDCLALQVRDKDRRCHHGHTLTRLYPILYPSSQRRKNDAPKPVCASSDLI